MNWQLWALGLLLAGSLSLTYAEKAAEEEKLPAIVVVEEKSAESVGQNKDDSESSESMPIALEPVPIVPAEEISGSPVKPAFRVSKVNADKVVAFITRAGQIFEIEDENGIGMIEGRQAGQIANATDNYVCNMGSVLIYSDEPCDEIAVLDSDTVKKQEEAQAASEVEQTQREQSNQQRRRKNAAAKKRKQQQLLQKRRKANQQKRRPNQQKRRPQQQLTQQQKRNRNKRLQAKRRKQQQQLQQLEEDFEQNVQTIKVKRPRPQSLQKRRQQQMRKRRRQQQQQKRRRQQQKQKQKKKKQQKQQLQQQNGVVMAGMAAVAGGGSGPQIQVLPQQSPGNGQRIRLLVRRGQGVRLDQNADYPRWQWADEYDN